MKHTSKKKRYLKKWTKIILWSVTGLLTAALAGGGYYAYQNFIPHKAPIDKNASFQSNYYQVINKDYLEKTKIPDDQPTQGATYQAQNKVDKQLQADLDDLKNKKLTTDITGMDRVVSYYGMARDSKKLNKDGTKPAKPYLKSIEDLDSIGDLNKNMKNFMLTGMVLPYSISLTANEKDTSQYIVTYSETSGILPDTSIYKDQAQSKYYFDAYEKSAVAVMKDMGYSEAQAKQMVKETVSMDKKMAKYRLSVEEMSDTDNTFHLTSGKDLQAYAKSTDLLELGESLVNQSVSEVNVTNPKYFRHLDEFTGDQHFKTLKSWLLVQNAMNMANYLDRDTQEDASQYQLTLSGQSKLPSQRKKAYQLTSDLFMDSLSVYYGKRHFSDEAKKQVTEMVDKITATYKKRLQNNTWLSKVTRDRAVEKLDDMTYNVGYIDTIDKDIYSQFEIDPTKSLLENTYRVNKIVKKDSFASYNEKPDISDDLPSFSVNAMYNPWNNSINIPAAILLEPFYDKNASQAANYGGIGAVIGHEISHAFDNNGANYDKYGNKNNWWTEEDRKAFDKKTSTLIKQWDNLELYGISVNAKQTVAENSADLSGLKVSLQTLQQEAQKVDLKEFFESYAVSWREVGMIQYYKAAIPGDVHAPAELRVNQIVKNLDEFYEAYAIKKGDTMYLPKEERLTIW